MEREQRGGRPAGPRLGERPEGARRVVVEAAHPAVGAVVVVEGAVLLHEEDDVLDRPEVRARRRGRGRRPGHGRPGAAVPGRRRQDAGPAGRQRGRQEGAAVEAGARAVMGPAAGSCTRRAACQTGPAVRTSRFTPQVHPSTVRMRRHHR